MSQDAAAVEPGQEASDAPPPNPRFLKGLVIVMGVLLVVGFIVVFATIIYRAVNLPSSKSSSSAGGGFGELSIPVPPDARVERMVINGNRLHVQTTSASGDQILVMDTRTGAFLGRVLLTKSAE